MQWGMYIPKYVPCLNNVILKRDLINLIESNKNKNNGYDEVKFVDRLVVLRLQVKRETAQILR